MLKMTRVKVEKMSDIYLLKTDQEEEFPTLLKDMLKQIINT